MIDCRSGTHHTETGSSIEAWNVTPSSFRPCVVAAIASLAAVLSSAVVFGQTERDPDPADPATRQEQLRRQREARLDTVEPYRAGRLERLLINLENEQTIENLFEEPSPSSGGVLLHAWEYHHGRGTHPRPRVQHECAPGAPS